MKFLATLLLILTVTSTSFGQLGQVYEVDVPVTSPILELGDDVYAKPGGADFTATPWAGDHVIAEPIVGQPIWMLDKDGLTTIKSFIIYQNAHSDVVESADDGTDTLTLTAHGITEDSRVYVSGSNLPANLVVGDDYYAENVATNTLQLSATSGGSVINIGAVSGTLNMTLTATSKRSSADQIIGTIPAQEAALKAEAEFASQTTRLEAISSQTTATAIRDALGISAANLDTQLSELLTRLKRLRNVVTR